jgi:galactosamine-6-phosphate isomerase
MMQQQILSDHEAMSLVAANWLIERLHAAPDALFCLATGATPMRAYSLLAERHAVEPQLFERMRALKLDEWGGLAMTDPASCEQYLRRALIGPLRLENRYTAFDSQPENADAECARIARWLEENGPIDTCVLGLGVNGHLGFNEPAAYLQPHAHVARLSAASLGHAMLASAHHRPTYGLTLGMADLLQARHILLLVSGASKAEPLRRLLSGRIATDFPASLLWLHPNVGLACDAAACSAGQSQRMLHDETS